MSDLRFNIETMDLEIKNGDFVLETNPSVQNGGIILKAKNFNVLNITLGVGIAGVLESSQDVAFSYLNKWKSQVYSDGGKFATWSVDTTGKFNTKCSYI